MLGTGIRLLAIAIAGTALAACSSGQADGDKVVVYSGRSESLVKPLFDQFTEQTGVRVEARFGDSAELSAQIAEEGLGTPAQVFFSQDAGALGALTKANMLAPIPGSVAARVPEQYRSADWVGTSARVRTLVYDPSRFPKPPKTVFDLTDSKYAGQVALAPKNASFQSFVTAMRLTEGDERTRAWLQGLTANRAQIFDSNLKIVEAVDAGTAGIGLVNHYYWYIHAREHGGATNIKVAQEFMAPGDPGTLINLAGVALTKANANSVAATRFLEFLLSQSSQQYFAQKTFEYPVVAGIPGPEGSPALSTLKSPPIKLDDLSDLPATQEMLRQVGLI